MVWIAAHLPLTAATAAAGMVSLIEHAGDAHTPTATAWLLSGSSALLLVCLAVLVIWFYVFARLATRPVTTSPATDR